MKRKDPRFRVFVCMARMNDGIWYPMPEWGAANSKREAAKLTRDKLGKNTVWLYPNGKFRSRMKFVELHI